MTQVIGKSVTTGLGEDLGKSVKQGSELKRKTVVVFPGKETVSKEANAVRPPSREQDFEEEEQR